MQQKVYWIHWKYLIKSNRSSAAMPKTIHSHFDNSTDNRLVPDLLIHRLPAFGSEFAAVPLSTFSRKRNLRVRDSVVRSRNGNGCRRIKRHLSDKRQRLFREKYKWFRFNSTAGPSIRRDIKTVVFFFVCVEGVGAICRRQPDSGTSGSFFFFQFSRRWNRPRNRKSLETRRRDVLVA